jgi:mono/diheme cytochrome c family protein
MTRRTALMAAALSLCGCTEACDRLHMRQQLKYEAYEQSDFWEDGLAMRVPPAGTVSRERPRDAVVSTGRDDEGEVVKQGPLPVTPALLKLGRTRFESVCAACHGLVADGDSVVAHNMSLRPPPSLHAHREHPDGWYFEVITKGFGLMPSFAQVLLPEERWAVVAYLRALQLSQSARLDQVPPEERARLQQGGPQR